MLPIYSNHGENNMLYLKKLNTYDNELEYLYLKDLPLNENGFINNLHNISKEEFMEVSLPKLINYSNGIDLPSGYVPETNYFLWNEKTIVGLFRLRHFLNDSLRNGSGHIGYQIHRNFRRMGFASSGLALAIDEAKKIIPDDEVYMSTRLDNIASLKVQLYNNAYIHHTDNEHYYTRIRIK